MGSLVGGAGGPGTFGVVGEVRGRWVPGIRRVVGRAMEGNQSAWSVVNCGWYPVGLRRMD